MELGGNIVLKGFGERDYAELIVVKKIVGRYARELVERGKEFSLLELVLHEGSPFRMDARLIVTETFSAEAADQNLFVCLDAALKKLSAQL